MQKVAETDCVNCRLMLICLFMGLDQVDRLWLLPSAHLSDVVTNGPSCLPYPLLCVYFVCVFCCLIPYSKFWLRQPGLSSLQAQHGNLNGLLTTLKASGLDSTAKEVRPFSFLDLFLFICFEAEAQKVDLF